MRILVTGGAGFIGSHLIRRLLEKGQHQVVNLDALRYSGNLDNLADVAADPRYTFVHGDICSETTVAEVFGDFQVEAVINCAAENHVDRSLMDPINFARTDVLGTALLLEGARKAGVTRFLQVSTDEVYGSVESGLSQETDVLCPRSPYSASKAAADLLVLSYWASYKFPVLVTRGSNTYGSHQYPEKFIPLAITNALENSPIPLYGDGRNRRDWLSVFDHCAAIEKVFQQGETGNIYNIGGTNEEENLTVAKSILQQLGKPLGLIRFVEDRPGHDRRYAVDWTRLRALGWTPSVSFRGGLEDTVKWYCSHEDWWRKAKSGRFPAYYEQMYGERLKHARPYVS